MKITILGCGGSMGVPKIGHEWGKCDPKNPKNKRMRSSILIEHKDTTVLIDTGPDLRQQLLNANIDNLDAVLYTHAHADHTHGINELRPISLKHKKPLDIYGDEITLTELKRFFPLPFAPVPEDRNIYKLHLTPHLLTDQFNIADLNITPFPQDHGYGSTSWGYKINKMAYSTDVHQLDQNILDQLKDSLDLWIIDCYSYSAHPTHLDFKRCMEWINYVNPKRAILTHMSEEMDYAELDAKTPPHVTPAHDGMTINL